MAAWKHAGHKIGGTEIPDYSALQIGSKRPPAAAGRRGTIDNYRLRSDGSARSWYCNRYGSEIAVKDARVECQPVAVFLNSAAEDFRSQAVFHIGAHPCDKHIVANRSAAGLGWGPAEVLFSFWMKGHTELA